MIVALVFLAMISGVTALGESLGDLFNFAARALIQAMSGAAQSGTGQP
jgi:Flp pilus assembly pilin Flp